MSSSYHIPFPTNFLTVNTPTKKSDSIGAPAVQPQQPDHGFLSNRPATVERHQSVSSVSTTSSAPPSPPARAAASPVLAAKSFTPLALNAKSRVAPASLGDMTPVARSAFLSNRGAGW